MDWIKLGVAVGFGVRVKGMDVGEEVAVEVGGLVEVAVANTEVELTSGWTAAGTKGETLMGLM